MHDTAYLHGRLFFELYWSSAFRNVVELGSQNVNGSLRDHCPAGVHYIGLDAFAAKGVDVVVEAGETLPIASSSVDAVLATSVFEHDCRFWDTFLEMVRILRPGGLIYLNSPSNHVFHRYPLDCWRFYPDAGIAFVRLAERHGSPVALLESFVGLPQRELWADFVAVFRKAGGGIPERRGRIADRTRAINVYDLGMPVGGSLQAQTLVMPDLAAASNLRADLRAREADLVAERRSNAELLARVSAARSHAADLESQAKAAWLRVSDLEAALAAATAAAGQ
jgi:SAM-dependent methyltransferase